MSPRRRLRKPAAIELRAAPPLALGLEEAIAISGRAEDPDFAHSVARVLSGLFGEVRVIVRRPRARPGAAELPGLRLESKGDSVVVCITGTGKTQADALAAIDGIRDHVWAATPRGAQ